MQISNKNNWNLHLIWYSVVYRNTSLCRKMFLKIKHLPTAFDNKRSSCCHKPLILQRRVTNFEAVEIKRYIYTHTYVYSVCTYSGICIMYMYCQGPLLTWAIGPCMDVQLPNHVGKRVGRYAILDLCYMSFSYKTKPKKHKNWYGGHCWVVEFKYGISFFRCVTI